MNIRLKPTSPSRLKALASCPRYVPDYDQKDASMAEAAAEGTRLHDLCEKIVREHPPENWVESASMIGGAEDGPLLVEAMVPVAEQVLSLGIDKYANPQDVRNMAANAIIHPCYACESEFSSKLNKKQRLDFLAFADDKYAIIVDYKFTRAEPDAEIQMEAYGLTLFETFPSIQRILLLAPAPRVFADCYNKLLHRSTDEERIRSGITKILMRASDEFEPGFPCWACAVCSGNGRCPWQAASVSDIVRHEDSLQITRRMLTGPITLQERSDRREVLAWLDKFIQAGKDQDKLWAIENPGESENLPGWKVSLSRGKRALDPDRRAEAHAIVASTFMLSEEQFVEIANIHMDSLIEFVSLQEGISRTEAKEKINEILAPVMKYGAPYPIYRKVGGKKLLD